MKKPWSQCGFLVKLQLLKPYLRLVVSPVVGLRLFFFLYSQTCSQLRWCRQMQACSACASSCLDGQVYRMSADRFKLAGDSYLVRWAESACFLFVPRETSMGFCGSNVCLYLRSLCDWGAGPVSYLPITCCLPLHPLEACIGHTSKRYLLTAYVGKGVNSTGISILCSF